MTGVLYLRSRRVLVAAAGLAALHVLGLTVGARELNLRLEGATASDAAVPWLIFVPLLAACLIGMSVRSPLHDLDLTAARRMALWRVGHVLVLGAVAAVSTWALTRALDGPNATVSALRNLAGFVGLALLGARFIAGWLAWLPAVGWALPAVGWALPAVTLGDPLPRGLAWDWPVRYDIDYGAFVVAMVLLAAGLTAVAEGTREVRGELD